MRHRAVLAGCGAMSKGWLRALADTPFLAEAVEIVGMVDLDSSIAKERADEFNLTVPVGSDLAGILGDLKPDFLFDVVVPGARRDVVAMGLAAGCHVLSEKPMAASLAEARELIVLADNASRVHTVVQNRRFVAGVRRLRRLVDSGALGELTAIHADFFIGAHFGGFREDMDNVLLLDMAIHTFDAARFISGKTPLAVYCHESNPSGSWYRHGAAANAIFEMQDDVVFTYRGSWAAEGAATSWESSWRVVGTKGTVLWDGHDRFEAQVVASDQGFLRPLRHIEVPEPASPDQTLGHASVMRNFIEAIEAGLRPETDSHDNINSLGMVFGAIESARTRRRIELSLQG